MAGKPRYYGEIAGTPEEIRKLVKKLCPGEARVARLEQEMKKDLEGWSLAPVVEALVALRDVKLITAMTIIAELGDITRFDSPRQLMGFLGLCRVMPPVVKRAAKAVSVVSVQNNLDILIKLEL